MQKIHFWMCGLPLLLLAGCGPKIELTSLELKALQEREFETTKKVAFASTISVLQDMGYSVKSTDYAAGLIFAESPMEVDQNFLTRNKTTRRTRLSAFVEEFPKKSTVRLNFVTNDVSEHWFRENSEEETVILDLCVYQQIFDKIGEAVFLREKMY